MRKWCATVAMGALLALPLCAQQKDASTANNTKETSGSATTANSEASDFSIAPASSNLFAMPAAATPEPADIYSDWANNAWNRHAWGRLTPKYEVAGMFQYVNYMPGGGYDNFNSFGGTGSFTYNANSWLGLNVEVGGYHFKRQIYGQPIVTSTGATTYPLIGISGSFSDFMAGPRINIRHFDHFVPFGEVMFGASYGDTELIGNPGQYTFAMAAGGGIDVILTKLLAWRFFQADYLMTNFTGPLVSPNGRQNNFRIGTGAVLRWGYPEAPAKPIHPPTAACSANPSSVYQGTTEPVAIHVDATDVDKVGLTYSYTATGGTVEGTGPDGRWNPSGVAIGTYTVTAKVDNGHGGTTTCSADVVVNKRPIRPPTVSCAPERNPITSGERVAINTTASDPQGLPLTYSYAASGGQVSGTGPTAQFDSTGLTAGSYTVTCTADDGEQGGRASANTTVDVQAPKELEARLALHSIYFPTDRPSVANPYGGLLESQQKRLDSLAIDFLQYLKYKPDANLILTGHADKRGAPAYNLKLSERRVEAVKHYLTEHGVPVDHFETKALGEEKNLSEAEVKAMIEQSTTISEEARQKILKNLPTIVLANNRRVDLTLSTTGQQSVLGLPFNAEDAAELISRTAPPVKGAKPAAKKPAPKKAPKP